jgi:hypothetical protein
MSIKQQREQTEASFIKRVVASPVDLARAMAHPQISSAQGYDK